MLVGAAFVVLSMPVLLFWPLIVSVFLECYSKSGPDTLPLVISYLDSDEFTRGTAKGILLRFGKDAVDPLADTLSDSSQGEEIRAECAACLGAIGVTSKNAVDSLRVATADSSELVRCKSLKALWMLTHSSKDVLPGLTDLLKSRKQRVLYVTVNAIGAIGTEAQPAAIKLREVGRRDVSLKEAVRDALVAIGEGEE
jgi:HEAT repeat protein